MGARLDQGKWSTKSAQDFENVLIFLKIYIYMYSCYVRSTFGRWGRQKVQEPVTHFKSFTPMHSFHFIHVNSFMSIHSFQVSHDNSFMSVYFFDFNSFIPIYSFQINRFIHFIHFSHFSHFSHFIPFVPFIPFIHSFNHSIIRSFFHSFSHSFIHSFMSIHSLHAAHFMSTHLFQTHQELEASWFL